MLSRHWTGFAVAILSLGACDMPDSRVRTESAVGAELIVQWSVGRIEGTGPDLFGEISALLVDPLGRLHVVDATAGEVRVFGADGSYVRTYARRGQGPGELSDPVGIATGPDGAVWLLDVANNRYTLYDTAGVHVADLPRPASGYSKPWLGGFDETGRLADATFRRSEAGNELILVRWNVVLGGDDVVPRLSPADTTPLPRTPPDRFTVYEIDASGQRRGVSVAIPFSSGLRREFSPTGTIWEANTERYRLVEYIPGGDTVRRVERPHTAERITTFQLDSALAVLAERTSPELSYDEERIPGEWPALESFFADGAGRLWVRPIESPPVRGFDVHDSDGFRRVGSPVYIESNPRPQVRGDTLWGVTVGELGVQRVVRTVLTARR